MTYAPTVTQLLRQPVRVLNVNDSEPNRYMVTKMLRNAGFIVDEAVTGLDAIEMARVVRPMLLVLDIRLPDIDGMEVCRRLRADPDTAAVLVLHTSATFVSVDIKIAGQQVGGDAFLAQPFTSQELIATINSLVRLKRVEEVQRARADELAALDRRKDEFLAMLGHELRNPLAAISAAQAVIDRAPATDPLDERARGIIRRQLLHVTRLVDDLLDMSRVTQGKINLTREPIELGAVLRAVGDTIVASTLAARQQSLVVRVPDEPVVIDGDRARIDQIVTNLLDNASKYSDPGKPIELRLAVEDRAAVIVVRDHGIGISPEALPRLFGLFYQASPHIARASGGLGIGLSLVHGLTQLHGGQVAARSRGLGQGSELEVRLPLREAAPASVAAPVAPPPAPVPADAAAPCRVLIVDDNDDARDMLANLCELWGHEVDTAADGLSAVERALAREPAVALIDIGLPGIDGHEVARRIRADARGRDVVLVALTGYSSPEERAECASAGFDLHLAKPANTQKIAAVLQDPQSVRGRLAT